LRNRNAAPEEEDDINMTPMLDVVFIMLIFFVVTASFVKDPGVEVEKPVAASSESKERASILIAIAEDGTVWIDKRQVEVRQVKTDVERMISENPEGSVVIQADKKSKNGVMLQVMDSAKAAGANEVSISTTEL